MKSRKPKSFFGVDFLKLFAHIKIKIMKKTKEGQLSRRQWYVLARLP